MQEWGSNNNEVGRLVKPLELRASSVHKICTSKPSFDIHVFRDIEDDFIATLDKKGIIFEADVLDEYCETAGIKTKALAYKNQIRNKQIFEEDPFPDGAKTFIQELWLELNYDFYDVSLKSDDPRLLKGHAVEDEAIKTLGEFYSLDIKKNTERIAKGILSGECDVIYEYNNIRFVRDTKCPEDWKSFRKKNGVETSYYWQLVAYCYLYDAIEAYLDYLLMKTPSYIMDVTTSFMCTEDIIKIQTSNEAIDKLALNQRIKTFKIEGISESIQFLVKRLQKAEVYYNSLTYEECMNLVQ